jgi:general secretion pathway protein D
VDTEKRNVGQTLVILPRINADRSISLTIDQDNSRINKGATLMPLPLANGEIQNYPIDTVNTANLQVTAHARDGLTVAVGGMISQRITDAEEKVPLLGNIPVLGHLFKKTVRGNSRKQIVLLITPHVLETPEESDALARAKEAEAQRLDVSGRKQSGSKAVSGDSIFQEVPPAPVSTPAAPAVVPVDVAPVAPGNDFLPPAIPPAAKPSRTPDGDRDVDLFSRMARAAADAVRAPDAPPASGLQPAPLSYASRLPLRFEGQLEVRALKSWQKDGYYVTALRAINLGDQPATLTPTRIAGRWAAMVVERQQLTPAGSDTSWTWVYALSRQPFEQSLEQ